LVAAIFAFNQCSDVCQDNAEYVYYEAVYTSFADLRASVESVDPRPIDRKGKIYWKDSYLYINEPGKGIHVINNADPANPAPVSFINIPGSFDLAIRNNILYADSYTDLVAITTDIPGQEQEVGRVKDVFLFSSIEGFVFDAQRGVVTDWKKSVRSQMNQSDCSYRHSVYGMQTIDGMLVNRSMEAKFSAATASSDGGGSTTGIGGSFARFTISGDYLYALNSSRLEVFNIPHPASIEKKTGVEVGWDIETIFPLGQTLFLGSQTGMHIMDIQSPDAPKKVSTYSHIRSCDPVVVEDGFAYVTLRNGSQCGGFTNQLEVIDVTNLASPALVKIYPMTNPHGVGIDNGTLFVCDGNDGLKVFDATDRLAIDANQIAHYKDIQAFDIIPFNNVAMVIGESGLYQYDYSNIDDIKLLSHLPIGIQQ
jgi:hypothetical protein